MRKIVFVIFSCILVTVLTGCQPDRITEIPPDTTATEIVSVTAIDSTTVLITFNKARESNAGNIDNYEITSEKDGLFSRLTVTAAALSEEAKQVTLTTENQTAVTFTVKIINVFSEEDSKLLDSSKNNTFEGKVLNVAGTWTGIATSGAAEYFYSWDINQSQENVTGVITIALEDKSKLSTYEFSGTFEDKALQFEGIKFIDLADGAFWCMAKGTLNYTNTDGKESFEGTWGPHAIAGGCPEGSGGNIQLTKE